MKYPPRLLESPLTGQVYVVTRYSVKDGYLLAQTKYDVTEDFKQIVANKAADPDTEKAVENPVWFEAKHDTSEVIDPADLNEFVVTRIGSRSVRAWPTRSESVVLTPPEIRSLDSPNESASP